MREKFIRFMNGRNGMDELARAASMKYGKCGEYQKMCSVQEMTRH